MSFLGLNFKSFSIQFYYFLNLFPFINAVTFSIILFQSMQIILHYYNLICVPFKFSTIILLNHLHESILFKCLYLCHFLLVYFICFIPINFSSYFLCVLGMLINSLSSSLPTKYVLREFLYHFSWGLITYRRYFYLRRPMIYFGDSLQKYNLHLSIIIGLFRFDFFRSYQH